MRRPASKPKKRRRDYAALKTKRGEMVPAVRAGNEAGCNRNWVAGDGRLDGCIGSACMAWRWGEAQGRTRPPIDRKFCILPPKDGRKWLLDDDGDGTTVDDYLSYLKAPRPRIPAMVVRPRSESGRSAPARLLRPLRQAGMGGVTMPRRLTLPRRPPKAPPIIACGCGRCIPVTEAVAVSLYWRHAGVDITRMRRQPGKAQKMKTPADLKAARLRLGLSPKDAADLIGWPRDGDIDQRTGQGQCRLAGLCGRAGRPD